MQPEDAIKTLQLFNEKVNKLESLSFSRTVDGAKVSVSIDFETQDNPTVKRTGPEDEAIEAFVLTTRFFIQDNEAISLRNMANLYNELFTGDDLLTRFNDTRSTLNKYLDDYTFLTVNKEHLTRRRILEVFIYGGLSHATPAKKLVYDSWVQNAIAFPLLQNLFMGVLAELLAALSFIRQLNIEAIDKLK